MPHACPFVNFDNGFITLGIAQFVHGYVDSLVNITLLCCIKDFYFATMNGRKAFLNPFFVNFIALIELVHVAKIIVQQRAASLNVKESLR